MKDIVELVIEDHREVAELFDQLQAETDPDNQAKLFAKVKEMIERHSAAEEKVLYPKVKKEAANGEDEVEDAMEEHDEIRSSLEEVEEHEPGTELFSLAVAQLVATTKHHVGVEEQELLPDFVASTEPSEREELADKFEAAKHASVKS